jgi:hypothetical protein
MKDLIAATVVLGSEDLLDTLEWLVTYPALLVATAPLEI